MIVDVSKENCIRAAGDGDCDTVRRYFAQLTTHDGTKNEQDGRLAACLDNSDDPTISNSSNSSNSSLPATTSYFCRNQLDMTRTLFAEAIENGHIDIVLLLLTPPVRTCVQQPLHSLLPELLALAIDEDDADIVACLLARGGADANGSSSDRSSHNRQEGNDSGSQDAITTSPLCRAAELGLLEVAQVLVAHGADVRARDERSGRTALHAAAKQGDAELVAFLLANGADANAQDAALRETPLVAAVKRGNCAVVALLVTAHVQLDVPNAFGSTALHIARVEGQREVCAMLEAAGATVLDVPRTPRCV